MEIKGLLKKVFKCQTGTSKAGKEWVKMGFVIQQQGKFTKDLYVESMNKDVIKFVHDSKLDTELTLNCEVESREWNEKYFTNVSCFGATADKQINEGGRKAYVEPAQYPQNVDVSDLPF